MNSRTSWRSVVIVMEPTLDQAIRAASGRLETVGGGIGTSATAPVGEVQVAAKVVEVRPSSFDLAVRIRWHDEDDVRAVDGRFTLAIVGPAGERRPIPVAVRDELIALERSARDYA